MSVMAKKSRKPRWVRELVSHDSLADDLGLLGSWVGPRKGPIKRTQGEKEDYVLRRLLTAWKKADLIEFPAVVRAEWERDQQPDFVLSWPDGRTLGIEVTEAGEEDYQAWLTHTEGEDDGAALEMPLEASTARTVDEFRRSIRRKVEKFDQGFYHAPLACDLVVYDNTAWGGFLDNQEILSALGRPNDLMGRFQQVHIVIGEAVYLDVFSPDTRCVDVSGEYEIDYARWIGEQIEQLKRKAAGELDFAHIAEELEDLGRSERRALASHLKVLMQHLLKWQFQPQSRSTSWQGSIENARTEIYELLTESPSLRGHLSNSVSREYDRSRLAAARESELSVEIFPDECPYTAEQLIDPEFFPDEGLSKAGATND